MPAGTITRVKARQLLDGNGRPVVEADIITEGGCLGRAGASTGTSVGAGESFVLRDNDPDIFDGLSVYKAIHNIETKIAPAIVGLDVLDQEKIDRVMIDLDGAPLKTCLGGNAIYAVSVAALRAAAAVKGMPLFMAMAGKPPSYICAPTSNVVNGGVYLDKTLAFQEFMVIPYDVRDMYEAVRIIVEVFLRLGKIIEKTNGRKPNMGNYSGYGAPSDDPFEVFGMIAEAVSRLGYEKQVCYAIDCAASEFYNAKEGAYDYRGRLVSREEIIEVLAGLAEKYPVAFIEDALEEEDFEGFKLACERVNSVIVGDDFLCTSLGRARKAVEMGAVRGMIFKPNQAGTITEALEAAKYMMDRDMLVIPSGRAGGVADAPEKEIGIALGMCLAKIGAPRGGARTGSFNFLMRLAEEYSLPVANIRELSFFSHMKLG